MVADESPLESPGSSARTLDDPPDDTDSAAAHDAAAYQSESEHARVMEGLAGLQEQLGQFDERARHREGVIDRLHAENQELRAGERRSILDPVITDLVRLNDQLAREALGAQDRGEGKVGGLLHSLADDVLLALERVGVEPFTAEIGDSFRSEIHRPLSAIDDMNPDRENTIARIVTQGFRDAESGRIRRKVQAHFYRYIAGSGGSIPEASEEE